MKANQSAFDVGQMIERLADGYYTHVAAIQIASDPRAKTLSPPGPIVPEGYIFRKDGTFHRFHFNHYLDLARTDPAIVEELARVWLVGALLRAGDELKRHRYFDRAPELELVRHLRNGVAHGNVFKIDNPKSLTKFPAHNRLAWIMSDTKRVFEITPKLQGRAVLFNFMGPADVVELLKSVGLYLIRMGNGDPLRP